MFSFLLKLKLNSYTDQVICQILNLKVYTEYGMGYYDICENWKALSLYEVGHL